MFSDSWTSELMAYFSVELELNSAVVIKPLIFMPGLNDIFLIGPSVTRLLFSFPLFCHEAHKLSLSNRDHSCFFLGFQT